MSDEDLARAALEWRAEDHASQARVDAKVADLNESENPTAPPKPKTPEDVQAEEVAAAAEAALPMLLGLVWQMADRVVVSQFGAHCSATEEERASLVRLSVPVLNKYLPGTLSSLLKTPEGALLGAVVFTYGIKVAVGPPAPAAPTEVVVGSVES